jgi:hypothetical protein
MFSSAFLAKLGKESLVSFVVTFGGVFLATGDGLEVAALSAGVVAAVRAVVGVVVRNVGAEQDSPHL